MCMIESNLGCCSLGNGGDALRDRLGLGLGLGPGLLGDGLLQSGDDALQLLQATVLLLDLAAQSLDLVVKLRAGLVGLGKIAIGRVMLALDPGGGEGVGTKALQLIGALPGHVDHDLGSTVISVHVATSQMFAKVLLACEPVAGASVAIGIGAHQRLLCVGVLLVNFALVTQKTARVGKALNLITAGLEALVGTVVFIHMFAGGIMLASKTETDGDGEVNLLPLTRTAEGRRRILAIWVVTEDLVLRVLGGVAGASDGKARARAIHIAHGLVHSGN